MHIASSIESVEQESRFLSRKGNATVGGKGFLRGTFSSILFGLSELENLEDKVELPDFFHDLNLNQIVDAITAGRKGYDLKPFFYARLTDFAAIAYRQEICKDLENSLLLFNESFAATNEREGAEIATQIIRANRWKPVLARTCIRKFLKVANSAKF